MKKTLIIASLLFISVQGFCQSATPLAQYSGNQIIYNPGYAGIYDVLSANLSVRKSWAGLKRSPSLISFSAHAPFQKEQHALGFVFQREQFGVMAANVTNVTYSHKIYFSNSILNLGVQAGLLNMVTDWDKIEFVMHPEDPGLGEGRQSVARFDANFGAYFQADKLYLGLSAKHLTAPIVDKLRIGDDEWYSQMRRQFFFIGGYSIALNERWDVRPEMLVKYEHTVPTTVHAGALLVFENQFFLGGAYSTGQKTLHITAKAQLLPNLRFGYSYDVHFGRIRSFQSGSHEISINYLIRDLWESSKTVDLLWL